MDKRDQITRGKAAVIVCLVLIIAFVGAISLSGCKEKAVEPKGAGPAPVGTCEIFNKLPKEIAKPVEINYGNRIKLMGITVEKLPKNQLNVSYYWQPMDELGPFKVFIHFTDRDNKILFQSEHFFCQKPLEELKGKLVEEIYKVDFPESAVGKEIFAKVGFYDPKLGGRLKIESAKGISLDESNTRAIIEKFNL